MCIRILDDTSYVEVIWPYGLGENMAHRDKLIDCVKIILVQGDNQGENFRHSLFSVLTRFFLPLILLKSPFWPSSFRDFFYSSPVLFREILIYL